MLDISTWFTALHSFTAAIVDQGDVPCTAYESVEMIGKDGIAMLLGWHAKGIAQIHRHEGIGLRLGREDSFVHRKDDEIVEIHSTCFEHTHDLKS